MQSPANSEFSPNARPKHPEGVSREYTCTRCGWRWTPRPNSPDPPRACARCRSAYWQSAPASSRANSPDNPKWQAERQSVARRRRERHLARLRELAAEFGLQPPPIVDELTIPRPVVPAPMEPHQPGVIAVDPKVCSNELTPPQLASPSISPAPRRSLAEELRRLRAQEELEHGPASPGGPGQPTGGRR